MPSNLQVKGTLVATAQTVQDANGSGSALALSTDKVGVGTTTPTQRLTVGSGNVLLPTAKGGTDGNLYFGGTTDTGQIGLRLFGGTISNTLQSGFIDVRAGTLADGLIFRVDTFFGGAERMRIDAAGNVGIGTAAPTGKLHLGASMPDIFLVGNTTTNHDGLRVHYNENLRTGVIDVKGASLRIRGESGATGVGATERLSIDLTNGHVGIGTTTPEEALDVRGNLAVSGDVLLTGADCAEDFDVQDALELEPGTVMVIDTDQRLCASHEAYDRRVAGVLSGAGDCRPGVILGRGAARRNRMPLALNGTVFCKADAVYAPIAVGDLLTTSFTRGYAMKASDATRAFGAVIGKALQPLTEGQGLIPILVTLH